eukprot:Opistho-1_new@86841
MESIAVRDVAFEDDVAEAREDAPLVDASLAQASVENVSATAVTEVVGGGVESTPVGARVGGVSTGVPVPPSTDARGDAVKDDASQGDKTSTDVPRVGNVLVDDVQQLGGDVLDAHGALYDTQRLRVPVDEVEVAPKPPVTLVRQQSTPRTRRRKIRAGKTGAVFTKSDLQCPICMGVLKQACDVSCGHSFCAACIAEQLKRQPQCPVCRGRITSVHPSFALRRLVDSYRAQGIESSTEEEEDCTEDAAVVEARRKIDETLESLVAQSTRTARQQETSEREQERGHSRAFVFWAMLLSLLYIWDPFNVRTMDMGGLRYLVDWADEILIIFWIAFFCAARARVVRNARGRVVSMTQWKRETGFFKLGMACWTRSLWPTSLRPARHIAVCKRLCFRMSRVHESHSRGRARTFRILCEYVCDGAIECACSALHSPPV